MQPQTITVSEFFAVINETLAFAYPVVTIEGEVSSFKINQGKFAFFDLKDKDNTLSCFMMAYQLKLPLEDGMKVRVTGVPKVTKFSKFSLTVRSVELAGEGALKRAMELMKLKLEAEGLFDPARKRALPRFPRRLGLITSSTSAAYADFIKILNARWSGVEVRLADVTVQGQTAPDQIVGALQHFNSGSEDVDVLVLIRGGGSLEDLSAFSTEPVARAVAASRTPIVVGVGHEVDTSLADLAADVRAATPTDAARLVVPDRNEYGAEVAHAVRVMEGALASRLAHLDHARELAENRLPGLIEPAKRRTVEAAVRLVRSLGGIDARVTQTKRRIELAESSAGRLLDAPRRAVVTHEATIKRELDRLVRLRVPGYVDVLGYRERQLAASNDRRLALATGRFDAASRLLTGLNPRAILARGYSITRIGGRVVRDATAVPAGTELVIELQKGTVKAVSHGDETTR